MDAKLTLADLIKDGALDLSVVLDDPNLPACITIECDRQGHVSRLVFSDGTVVGKIHVYLIRASNGVVKIGKTRNLAQRLKDLNTASPLDLELLGSVYYALGDQLELELHAQYADKRIKGEWFDLNEDDIEAIKYKFDGLINPK